MSATKKRGKCVRCFRENMSIKAKSLCAACYGKTSREGGLVVAKKFEQAAAAGSVEIARQAFEGHLAQFIADYKLASTEAAKRGDHRPALHLLKSLPLGKGGRRVLEDPIPSNSAQAGPQIPHVIIGLQLGGATTPVTEPKVVGRAVVCPPGQTQAVIEKLNELHRQATDGEIVEALPATVATNQEKS